MLVINQSRPVYTKGRKVLVRHANGFYYQEGEIVKLAVRRGAGHGGRR